MAQPAAGVPAMFRPYARYVDFMGRSNRTEFWLFFLFNWIVGLVFIGSMAGLSMTNNHFDWDKFFPIYMRFAPFLSLFNLASFLPNLAVQVRRLHDISRSGWWIVAPMIVYIASYIVFVIFNGQALIHTMSDMTDKMGQLGPASITPEAMLKLEVPLFLMMAPWVGIPTGVAYIFMLVLWALPGTPGPNRFGASLNGGGTADVF